MIYNNNNALGESPYARCVRVVSFTFDFIGQRRHDIVSGYTIKN